ncbi:MAG: glycoside hydrolase family 3 N-terminal domain-containing protein [Candidatus Bathyarchaeia archaeon]
MPRIRTPEDLIEEMSLKKIIGQTLVLFPESENYSDRIQKLLEDTYAGSLIFVAGGLKSAEETRKITEDLQRIPVNAEIGVPLFICSEHEYGLINLPPKATPFPSNMALAASRSVKNCYDMAFTLALELRSIGVNMNLGPTTNLNQGNDDHFGIYSFGDDATAASKFASAFVRGLQHGGISAVAKIFQTRHDLVPKKKVVIHHSLDILLSSELKPLVECIRVGVDAVLIGGASVPAIDASEVAMLSNKFTTGLLRNRFGFKGILVADLRSIDPSRLDAKKALEAGNDLLIIEESKIAQISEDILTQTRKSRIFARRVKEAALHILRLKFKRLNRFRRPSIATYGASLHWRLAQKIANESVTVVRNDGSIPITKENSILIISPKLSEVTEKGTSLLFEAMKRFGRNARDLLVSPCPTKVEVSKVIEDVKGSDKVVICSLDGHLNREYANMVKQCLEINPKAIVVSVGSPYDLNLFQAQNCLATFGWSLPSLEAAAGVILGRLKPTGVLPIKFN